MSDRNNNSLEVYRLIFEHAPIGIFLYDSKGILLDCNKSFIKLMGSSRKKLIGLDLLSLPNEKATKAIRSALNGKSSCYDGEYISFTGGKQVFLHTFFEPVLNNKNGVAGIGLSEDVTEQVMAQKKLERNEEILKQAQQVAKVGSWHLDIPSNRLEWSEETFRIFELPFRDEITLEDFLSRVHPEDLNRVAQSWNAALHGTPYDIEHRIIAGDKVKWVREHARVCFSEDGKALEGLGTIQDISDVKKIELDLREVLNYREALLSAVPDIIMEVDINKVYTYANRAGRWFFGDDVIGKEASFYFEGEQETYEIVSPLFDGDKELVYVESWQRRRDGHKRLLAWWCHTLRNAEGRIIGTVSSARDITEERKLHQEILQSRKQYKELAENAPLGIMRADKEGKILYINPKAEEILGFSGSKGGKFYEQNIFSLLLFKEQCLSNLINKVFQKKRYKIYETHYFIDFNKDIWVRMYLTPIVDEGECEEIQIIFEDITERKRNEELRVQEERKLKLILDGIPNPAWLITGNRKIVHQNKAADIWGSKTGGFCWKEIFDAKQLSEKYKKELEQTGQPLPGTQCSFCQADKALDQNKSIHIETEIGQNSWQLWWVPLESDLYLHYAINITEFKQIQEKFRLQAITDELTNLYNRRYFVKQLNREMMRSKRTQRKFSLIMIDVDHFKQVNDLFGHNVGDEVLKNVSNLIRNRIRNMDIAARWGGEEFVIFMPETSVEGGAILAESLRQLIEQSKLPGIGHVTASFGVAGYHEGDSVDIFINRADKLMYAAKQAGRNTIKVEQK